ncbi:MAG: molybdate ABC transporter substrate-binding protein [Nitrososphaerales archaeon]
MRGKVAITLIILVGLASGLLGFLGGSYFTSNPQKTLKIFWGVATRLPGTEIINTYEEATNVNVEATFAGAGQLLTSISLSKSGDLYLGVGTIYELREAIDKGVIDPTSVRALAYLVPAIIVSKGNPKNISSLNDLVKPSVKVCLTNPDYGVGLFTRKLLEYNGLWDEIKSKYVEAESGEKAVAYVSLHSVDATVSWHVFYYWNNEKVDIVWIEPHRIPEISTIPAAILVYTKDRKASETFLDFVSTSRTAKEIFSKYGYISTLEQATKYTPYTQEQWQRWVEGAENVIASLYD